MNNLAGLRPKRLLPILAFALAACPPPPPPPLPAGDMCVVPETSGAPPRPLWGEQPNAAPAVVVTTADPASIGKVVACDPAKLGQYPVAESGNPNRKGADLQNLSTNFHVTKSLEIVVSAIDKAVAKLQKFQSDVNKPDQPGYCTCNGGLADPSCTATNKTREDCAIFCDPIQNTSLVTPCSGVLVWTPNDIFKTKAANIQFALNLVGFLDEMQNFTSSDFFNDVVSALTAIGSGLENLNDLLIKLSCWVDLFSEGYHLGSYSEQRPDLHMCIGYYGHGAYARLTDGSRFDVGGRYTSANLSEEHRAQMRTGGFGVTAFGKTFSLLPNPEFNVQIDGYKFFDACAPLGIDALGDPMQCGLIGSYPPIWVGNAAAPPGTLDMDDVDIFSLADRADLQQLDSNGDNILALGEFLVTSYSPFAYTSAVDGNTYTWPRSVVQSFQAANGYDEFEGREASVISAGLNINPELTPIEKQLPTITIVPGVFVTPILRPGAGAAWTSEAFELRKRLQDAINTNLPAPDQFGISGFERNMHAFQAPDLTADDGTTAYVTPGVEVLVTIGLQISSAIQLGIFASIGLDVELRPGGHGGIVDASRGLTQALHDSNPPDNLPCSPTISQSVEHVCSDMQYDSLEPGSDPDSTYACTEAKGHSCCVKFTVSEGGSLSNVYACIDDWTGIDEAHCGCATADTKECLRDYQPYLSATTYGQVANAMAITQIQSTWNASQSCADCKKDGSCPIQESPSDPPFDNPCETHGYCVDGATTTYDVLAAQCAGEFHRYGCVPRVISEVSGWTGPGCHPLNQGFPSACGCGASSDCASGETCNAGRCENGSGPVDCSCDPGISGSCPSGRSCIDGACVIDCGACGAATTCSSGHCLPSSGVPFAEQIVWTSTHVPSPLHSIESYGLVDFKLQAILDAALEIALKIKLFKKVKEFKVWDWSDAWDLGSTWKSKYQPGLEAQYEDPCDPIGTVTNHEPSAWGCSGASTLVCRYPSSADSAWASYDTPTELIAACKDEMPLHVENPPAPTGADFADGLTDLADFGLSVGETVWNQSQLCVGDGKQTFTEWLTSLSASPSTLSCTYTGPTPGATPTVFPCAATDTYLLQIWGCLDTSAAPSVVTSLGTISPMYSSSLTDPSVVDLAVIVNPANGALIGPAAVLPAPQKLQVYAWLAAVEACFDNHHAAEEPCVQLTGASGLHRCCGDGVKLASEACDDGNTAPGDGCAYDCTIEAPKP